MNTRIGVAPQGQVITWRRHGPFLFALDFKGEIAATIDVHKLTEFRSNRLIALARRVHSDLWPVKTGAKAS